MTQKHTDLLPVAKPLQWVDGFDEHYPERPQSRAHIEVIPHSVGQMLANYTARHDRHTDTWESTFWCGNMGHTVDKWLRYRMLVEAKAACQAHYELLVRSNTRKADCHEELVGAATALGLNYNYCCDGAEVVVFAGGDEVIYHGNNKDGEGNGKAFKAIKDFTDALARATNHQEG